MRFTLLLAAGLLSLESAAIACSCLNTDDPAELQRIAANSAEQAVAVVEAEALSAYQSGTGEQMRVLRTIAGTAPVRFTIERGPSPSSASCDILYSVGQRDTVILYPAERPSAGSGALPVYRTSGLCTQHLLDKPVFRRALIDAIRAPAGGYTGERG